MLAQDIIDQLSGFVDQKIASFKELDASLTQQLASNQRQIEAAQAALKLGAGNLTVLEQLVLQGTLNAAVQQKGQLLIQQSDEQAVPLPGRERREAAVRRPADSDEDDGPQHA